VVIDFAALRSRFRGEVLDPGVEGYEAARRIWNGMIDRRPEAIARCSHPGDVLQAVRFAAERGIYPAVRAGGHNVAGTAMAEGGLVIDVSRMKRITVDLEARTAKAETGLTWGEFDNETCSHGLATTGGLVSSTGIAGLTLGGGIGWLMGRCGLACDNTLAYDVATADGKLIQATADAHPDLFWALKGGGGNFGVVTSITYRLHPIHAIASGVLLFPFSQGRDVLRRYRDFVSRDLPDELIVYAVTMRLPIGIRVIAILPAYCGEDLGKAQPWIDSLKQFGTVLADLTARMPYVAMQRMLDVGVPHGIRSYWKSSFLEGFPDTAVDVFMNFMERCPSRQTLSILEHSHGAAARVPCCATAFPRRKEGLALVIFGLWNKAEQDDANIAWTREFHIAMRTWSAGSVYVNSLSEDESDRVREAYGQNFERLRAIKAKYDPQNRFRRNQNIPPQPWTEGR